MENYNHSESYRRHEEYLNKPMSVGEWFITILVAGIPLIGLIMLFVWAFSGNTNTNRANWAKAMLIWAVISIVIGLVIFGIVGIAFLHDYGY